MAGRLQDRVAIVTGAGQGIGQAIAAEYAAHGAVVAVADCNPDGVATTCEALNQGGRARPFVLDVADYDAMRDMRGRLLEEFGQIDILVNNAAIPAANAELLDSTLEDWRRVLQVDLEAVYMASRLMAEVMVPRESGRIIHTASIQAFMTTGRKGAYNAAKAGVIGLTHSMAVELAPYNILVNAIAPGFIQTPMSRSHTGEDETETESFKTFYLRNRRIPLGRAGQPRDVAGAALFLASDDCRYLTGQTLVVDGGLSLTI